MRKQLHSNRIYLQGFLNFVSLHECCVKCMALKLTLLLDSVFPVLKVEVILVIIPKAIVASPLFVYHVCGRPENFCVCLFIGNTCKLFWECMWEWVYTMKLILCTQPSLKMNERNVCGDKYLAVLML